MHSLRLLKIAGRMHSLRFPFPRPNESEETRYRADLAGKDVPAINVNYRR